MPSLRLLIVDDEPLARDRVRSLLAADASIEIVGECGSGASALTEIRRLRPDVVLLDIQISDGDGLHVAATLGPTERPVIIFVTAHERFAVPAFDVQAVDFVLKPFDRERLQLALQRARERIRVRRASDLAVHLQDLLTDTPNTHKSDRLMIKTDGRLVLIRYDEIAWIEAANNYSILHTTDNRRLIVREAIGQLEERFGGRGFVRISRSAVVRVDAVQELQPTEHGDYTVVLRDGSRLGLSRQLRGRLDLFGPEP